MSRSITALAGQEKQNAQIPVSLVYLALPSGAIAINDIDADVYLNMSNNAVSMTAQTGYTKFSAYAGLAVPLIQVSSDVVLGGVTFSLANVDQTWYSVLYANTFRDASATIWQAAISMNAGDAPEAATAVGAVKVYTGRIEQIQADHQKATIQLAPHITPWTMTIPYRKFSPSEFKFLPAPNQKLVWGYSETVV
jgi:hypothetical protein